MDTKVKRVDHQRKRGEGVEGLESREYFESGRRVVVSYTVS